MKPLVYFDFKECNGDGNLVSFEKERLKEILKEVYEAGFVDGNRAAFNITPFTGLREFSCNVTPRPTNVKEELENIIVED